MSDAYEMPVDLTNLYEQRHALADAFVALLYYNASQDITPLPAEYADAIQTLLGRIPDETPVSELMRPGLEVLSLLVQTH